MIEPSLEVFDWACEGQVKGTLRLVHGREEKELGVTRWFPFVYISFTSMCLLLTLYLHSTCLKLADSWSKTLARTLQ